MERKRKSADMKIAEFEAKKSQYQAKIETYKAKISDLDAKIKGLSEKQKQKDLENLLNVIKQSGQTPEEVLAALKSDKS